MNEETSTPQVPLLDLAPKRKRPLSLWNPLDYLLLLYWVFYFPKAIPWYISVYENTFDSFYHNLVDLRRTYKRLLLPSFFSQFTPWHTRVFRYLMYEIIDDTKDFIWEKFLILKEVKHPRTQLVIMAILLNIFIAISFYFGLNKIGIKINWIEFAVSNLFSLFFIFNDQIAAGISISIVGGLAFSIVNANPIVSNIYHLSNGTELSVMSALSLGSLYGSASGLICGIAYSNVGTLKEKIYGWIGAITINTSFIIMGFIVGNIKGGLSFFVGLTLFLVLLVKFAKKWLILILGFFTVCLLVGILVGGSLNSVISTLVIILAFWVTNFLISAFSIARLDELCFSFGRIPHTSQYNFSWIRHLLIRWLESNWISGISNANQIFLFSHQSKVVQESIFESLASSWHTDLVYRMAILSDLITDIDILHKLTLPSIKSRHVSIAAQGFWHFHKASSMSDCKEKRSEILLSINSFEKIRDIRYGEEMYVLSIDLHNLSIPQNYQELLDYSTRFRNRHAYLIEQTTDLNQNQLIRLDLWNVINQFYKVLDDIYTLNQSISRTSRSFSLNRALGEISKAIDILGALSLETSRAEKPILKDIATRWRDILLAEAGSIGQVKIDKPIANPYTIGDPVIGERFIGREDILRQLEELWFINPIPQSIILYGHRRMGKTSILRNATTKVNDQVRIADVNLLTIGNSPNATIETLMAICDAIAIAADIAAPRDQDFIQFPATTFRRHLEYIDKTFTGKLIIALDEFEKIEELIDSGKLRKELLGFLRGMVQMSSKLAFAFAGLHTLQEMNADYFQPFYASFIPISVAFLNRDATHQVLANPDPEFLLEYEPAALDHIYDLTNGQPYLTQLIGFQLVRMFNDYVFEQGKPRDRTFTIDDVRTICSGENFFTTGFNYFNGVWQQASEGAAHQQDILKALAPYPQGITESELISQTNLPSETLQAALKTLKDHDVIRSQKTNEIVNWAIAVELFRNWVVKYKA
jgi:hypothetical protein